VERPTAGRMEWLTCEILILGKSDALNFLTKRRMLGVADEFVRLSCREHAGWRRDEWAHSPLFIWCKFLPETAADLTGSP
jgi:hypothetical protein